MLDTILHNLENAGWAMLIFLSAYISNMAFSLYYNIKQLQQPFDKEKLINSGLKVASIVVGLVLLVVGITALPAFASHVGWEIPEEYSKVFSDLAVIGVCLVVSCKYFAEAITKFTAILDVKQETE